MIHQHGCAGGTGSAGCTCYVDRGEGVAALAQIAQLPKNWDSYGAPRISFDVHQEALRFYDMIHSYGVPEPFILPLSDGGIAFEWNVGDDTEVSVRVGP